MIMVDACHSTFVKTHGAYNTSREAQCSLRALVHQWRFMHCNKPLVEDVGGIGEVVRRGYRGGGEEGQGGYTGTLCTFSSVLL